MLGAYATRLSNSVAAIYLAHFPAATAVQAAPASLIDCGGAIVEGAEPFGTMRIANAFGLSDIATTFSRALQCLVVVLPTFTPGSVGVGDARVRCAVPKGTMLDADKVAKHLRSVAGWIGAGQLYRVLEAQATSLLRIGAATTFQTLPKCTMFVAHTFCNRLGGAALRRAWFSAVRVAEASSTDVLDAFVY